MAGVRRELCFPLRSAVAYAGRRGLRHAARRSPHHPGARIRPIFGYYLRRSPGLRSPHRGNRQHFDSGCRGQRSHNTDSPTVNLRPRRLPRSHSPQYRLAGFRPHGRCLHQSNRQPDHHDRESRRQPWRERGHDGLQYVQRRQCDRDVRPVGRHRRWRRQWRTGHRALHSWASRVVAHGSQRPRRQYLLDVRDYGGTGRYGASGVLHDSRQYAVGSNRGSQLARHAHGIRRSGRRIPDGH